MSTPQTQTPQNGWSTTPPPQPQAQTYYHNGKAVARIEPRGDGWHAVALGRTHLFGSSETQLGKAVGSEEEARQVVENWAAEVAAQQAGTQPAPAPAATAPTTTPATPATPRTSASKTNAR